MKKKFIVKIWSSTEDLDLNAEQIKYEIYENISNLETVEVEEIPFEKSREQQNKEWVQKAFDLVNWLGNWDDLAQILANHIDTEHRTLIQSFFRMIQEVINEYAKHEYFDDRNNGSLKWAKEVAKIKAYMPHI